MSSRFHGHRAHRAGSIRAVVITAIIVAVLFIVLLVRAVIGAAMAFAEEEAALASLATFVQPFAEGENLDDDLIGEPYIDGRVLVANAETGEAEYFYWNRLPETLRATTEDEVGTLVLYRKNRLSVGEYGSDSGQTMGNAYQWMYDVSVIDVSDRRVVNHHVLLGSMPPNVTQTTGDVYGNEPIFKLLEYVESMPIR